MESKDVICQRVIEFIKKLLEIYLENGDLDMFASMLHEDVSLYCANNYIVCQNYKEVIAFVEEQKNNRIANCEIIYQWLDVVQIREPFYLVFGEIQMEKSGTDNPLSNMAIKFTAVCHTENANTTLYHAHFFVPHAVYPNDVNAYDSLMGQYNIFPEKNIENHVNLLQKQNTKPQAIDKNIYSGAQICQYDENFTIIYASDGFSQLTGYTQQEIASLFGHKHIELILEEDKDRIKKEIKYQLENGTVFSVEYRIKRKDGKIIWIFDKGILAQSKDGQPKLQSILIDMTEQKEQSLILERKSFELETITNNIEGAIICCTFNEKFVVSYANDGLFRMIGYTREQFALECFDTIDALTRPDELHQLRETLYTQLYAKKPISTICRLYKRNGKDIWVLVKGSVVKNPENIYEFHGVLTDITEQHEQEEALRVSEKRYEITMKLLDVTMFDYNIVTKELTLYEKNAQMYGVTNVIPNGPETLIARGNIDPSTVEDYLEMYRKIHAGAPFAQCYVNTLDTEGVLHEFEMSLTTVYNKNNKPIRAIGVRKNMSQVRRLQKENAFGQTLVSNKVFVCEADITNDKMVSINQAQYGYIKGLDELPFSQAMLLLCTQLVVPSFREMIVQNLTKEKITEAYESGKKLLNFCYQKTHMDSEPIWYEATVNIIKQQGNLIIRYYTLNINEQKKKELKAQKEQKFYETMVAKAVMAFEVNISKNCILSGQEQWLFLLPSIEEFPDFSKLTSIFAQKQIHPLDREAFSEFFLRSNILEQFENGEKELSFQYRKNNTNEENIWFKYTLHLYENPQNGDLKGYVYIENIDRQKKIELALQYDAEHDALTGLYNKATTQRLITEFLNSPQAQMQNHAFIMIDIDHFKSINDNFGHIFGDAVLSQISAKISNIFREDDIVGRIGGDEFVVFMKNVNDTKIFENKAQEICDNIMETYHNIDSPFSISTSIGIAILNQHTTNYDELYKHSDSALYVAKNNGRNQYFVYHKGMEIKEFLAKDFDAPNPLEIKSFEDNVSEYIFRILYESSNKEASICAILGLVGNRLNVSRVYIFENASDNLSISNTYEWCSEGTLSHKDQAQNIPYSALEGYWESLSADGICFISDVRAIPSAIKSSMYPKNTTTALQFSIATDKQIYGFVGFDKSDYKQIPTKKEISDCSNIAQILGIFISEMRTNRKNQIIQKSALSILDSLDSYAYICDPASYTLLFANKKLMEYMPDLVTGSTCYMALWNRTCICINCPLQSLQKNQQSKYTQESPDYKKITASWIQWIQGDIACLLEAQFKIKEPTNI